MATGNLAEEATTSRRTHLFQEFGDPNRYSFIGLFYSEVHRPLAIWDKQCRGDGRIIRIPDENDGMPALYLSAHVNPENTYITTPAAPFVSLGIKLPFLTFIVMNLRRSITITFQIKDTHGQRRRFIMTNNLFQAHERTSQLAHIAMHFDSSWCWNTFQLNLAYFTTVAFHATFKELVRVQVSASCRLRMIYSSASALDKSQAVDILTDILSTVSDSLEHQSIGFEEPFLLVQADQPVRVPSAGVPPKTDIVQPRIVRTRSKSRERTSTSRDPPVRRRSVSIQPGFKRRDEYASIFSLVVSPKAKPLFPPGT